MRIEVEIEGGVADVFREPGEPRVSDESHFFYRLRNLLREHGEDVIKKEMAKDGHMVSEGIYYVRSRKGGPDAYAIWDGRYALRNTASDYNKEGHVSLNFEWEGGSMSLRKRWAPPLDWARV